MYQLRTATEADVPILYRIHRWTMFDYVNTIWGWEEEDQERRFQDYFRNAHIQVITVNSRDVGFLDVARSHNYIEVRNVELVPTMQGQGIGTAIMEDVITEAGRESLHVKLQVLKRNQGAKRLYQRLGFIIWDETPTHYLMKLEATPGPRRSREER